MPGELGGESDIPIAHYGSSNIGTMKRVYRNGLGLAMAEPCRLLQGFTTTSPFQSRFGSSR